MDDGVVGGIRVDKARGRGSSTMVAGVFAERIPWRTFRIPHSAFRILPRNTRSARMDGRSDYAGPVMDESRGVHVSSN
jgi:hypothetical protein